ncbi:MULTISPECIES: vWA domain-containing protein [Fictibacillus]|jgi:Mg-chelatase subunit ChlD|uniref:vWA domain-containing protein n=1 Tax=Fictibacillus TaxID=1329200 RepID=UPI0018CCE4BA|nr:MULTISPECIES: vWA domain-containing protein [unclassified Fictibacillus]MBH0158123.1 VWA domain-containing protein [Fictibacillus sp. 5RED26]MBH0167053.1 VWA domain-containing protein [Fictibacillus sp. 7GRE50]
MNKKITEIVFLLDRSGSMSGLERDTIGGFNSFIKRQVERKGKTLLTTVLFDDQYEILWNGVAAEQAHLTSEDYYVRGTTALLDAVGKTILDVGYRLSRTEENDRPGKVIFVITTDGMENASSEFTHEKVKNLIEHQQEKYNWDFIFMGANIDVIAEAKNLGIKEEDAFRFEATDEGVENLYAMMSEEIIQRRNK